MSGKHDKAGADEQAANLLLTGPIVIRGLGRGVKDALRPGAPSRHRAFLGEGSPEEDEGGVLSGDDVQPTPLRAMLASGPTVDGSGPSSELTEAPSPTEQARDDPSFRPDDVMAQTGDADGLGEDRVDDARPADAERSQDDDQHDRTAMAEDEAVQVADEDSGPDAEQPEGDADVRSGGAGAPADVVDDFAVESGDDIAGEGAEPGSGDEGALDPDANTEEGEIARAEAPAVDFGAPVGESAGPSDEPDEPDEPVHAQQDDAPSEGQEPDDAETDVALSSDAVLSEAVPSEAGQLEDDGHAEHGADPDRIERAAAEAGYDDAEAHAFVDAAQIQAAAEAAPEPAVEVADGTFGLDAAAEPEGEPTTQAATEHADDAEPEQLEVPEQPDAPAEPQVDFGDAPVDDEAADEAEAADDPVGDDVPLERERPDADVVDEWPGDEGAAAPIALPAAAAGSDASIAEPDADGAEFADESGLDAVAEGAREGGDPHEDQREAVGVDFFETTADAPPVESEGRVGTPALDSTEESDVPVEDAAIPGPAEEAALADTGLPPAADVDDVGTGTGTGTGTGDDGGVDAPQQPAAVVAAASLAATAAAARPRAPRPPGSQPGGTGRPPRRPRPMRERFGREAIGIAVLVVLALICGGLIAAVIVKTQRDAAIAAQEAANYTPPPLATPDPVASGPVVAVIGDGTVDAAAPGVTTAQLWTGLLGSSLSGTVSTDASNGMGYAAKGSSGETFVQAAAKVPSNAAAVVFFGGAADSNISALSLATAATDAYAAASKQAPHAKLIVVGPVISEGVSAVDLTAIRTALRSAAGIAKATWIDPIDSNWLSGAQQVASSPNALTAADEKTIAAKMAAAVTKAVG
ncbi:MAG: hypothetical protein HIU86_11600 [Acidobacteria bacterium]|nr:hypothetical protein [Acidobacteriota bacterium]